MRSRGNKRPRPRGDLQLAVNRVQAQPILKRISTRLDGGMKDWTDRDAEVYWFFLNAKLKELRNLAGEIDDEYSSD